MRPTKKTCSYGIYLTLIAKYLKGLSPRLDSEIRLQLGYKESRGFFDLVPNQNAQPRQFRFWSIEIRQFSTYEKVHKTALFKKN